VVKELRKAKAYARGDDRISADGEFVDQVLFQAEEGVRRVRKREGRCATGRGGIGI
jgi:hypothetical protein